MALGNLQQLIPAFFTGPNGEQLTPDQIAQRQKVAQSLLQQATDTSPNAGGWTSVLAKGLQGGIAGYQNRRADDAAALNARTDQDNISAALGSLGLGGGNAFPSAVAQGASPTSGVATGTVANIPQAPEIRQGLIDRGLQPHIADAFILNFQDESGLNPGINEANPIVAGSRGGYGLYQLTGPRRREYESFASERGLPLDSVDAQLDFMMQEGAGSEKSAFDKILASPDTATAAQAIVNNFLRPAPEHRQSRSARYANVATAPQELPVQVASADPNFMPQEARSPYPEAGNIAPYDFTGNQQLSVGAGIPMEGLSPEQFDSRFVGQTPLVPEMEEPVTQQQARQVDPRLLAQNDAALGGALSPTGSSGVAQALTGYFPEAPSGNRAPIQAIPQSQQQASVGVNPSVIASLLGPNSSPQARQVAGLLIGQHQQQQKAMQEQQSQQAALAQRQQVAQSMGIDPNSAMDAEAWKAAVTRANRDRNTVTVGNTVLDANTMQPIYEGQQSPTGDIQNYEYARQNGYGGSFSDYQQEVKRAGATNIDNRQMGSVPAGYQVQYDDQGRPVSMSPIPGSPDFIKSQREREAFEQGKVTQDRTSQVVTQDIDRAMDIIEQSPFTTTGAVGPALSKIGGTASNDVNQLITTIKANAGFDRLQAMREASPTGGALGAVSERELTYLQSTIGSLDQSQTKDQLIRNLQRVRQAYSDIIDGPTASNDAPTGSKTKTGVTWSVN